MAVGRKTRFSCPGEKITRARPGAVLFDPARPPRGLYVLRSGWVQLSSPENVILDYLGPGHVLGESSFSGGRPVMAKAVTPLEYRVYRRRELLNLLAQDRQFALKLVAELARRLERYQQAIGQLARGRVECRLIYALMLLVPRPAGTGWVRLVYSPTNVELARMIGATRWRVSRHMAQFQRLGWLRRDRGLWVNVERFNEVASLRCHQAA
jgi:CRP-like cAMP-binding protein